MFLPWTLLSICHWTYFHTSKGHVIWIIKKVNRIPTHCGVAYESVHSLSRGHVIRVCGNFILSAFHTNGWCLLLTAYQLLLSSGAHTSCCCHLVLTHQLFLLSSAQTTCTYYLVLTPAVLSVWCAHIFHLLQKWLHFCDSHVNDWNKFSNFKVANSHTLSLNLSYLLCHMWHHFHGMPQNVTTVNPMMQCVLVWVHRSPTSPIM